MNSINWTGRSNFPLSIDSMVFLQEMIKQSATLAEIGGDKYILSGCELEGTNVSAGYIVLNGEILPFTGGIIQEYVFIKEVKRSVTASGYDFPDVYTSRTVEFGINDIRYKWDDFKRVQTNMQLSAAIEIINTTLNDMKGIPKGVICMWSGSIGAIPEGWALCAGQADGIPNLLGRFIVGYDSNDADYNSIGKTGGAKEITLNISQIPPHVHHIKGSNADNGDPGTMATTATTQPNDGMNSDSVGEGKPHENRPPYFVLAYIIKL